MTVSYINRILKIGGYSMKTGRTFSLGGFFSITFTLLGTVVIMILALMVRESLGVEEPHPLLVGLMASFVFVGVRLVFRVVFK